MKGLLENRSYQGCQDYSVQQTFPSPNNNKKKIIFYVARYNFIASQITLLLGNTLTWNYWESKHHLCLMTSVLLYVSRRGRDFQETLLAMLQVHTRSLIVTLTKARNLCQSVIQNYLQLQVFNHCSYVTLAFRTGSSNSKNVHSTYFQLFFNEAKKKSLVPYIQLLFVDDELVLQAELLAQKASHHCSRLVCISVIAPSQYQKDVVL